MSLLRAALLALVQGATEFLPISSSAHLVLVPWLLGWPDQGLPFDVAVNTGTLVAVILYFRREVVEVTAGWFRGLAEPRLGIAGSGRLGWGIALGTVPVGVAGLLGYDFFAGAARSPAVIAATTLGFGLLLWWADRAGARERGLEELGIGAALAIGLAQALALVPGTSRSGVTMTAALALGYDRPTAARFSFLLAIPVGVLAGGHDLLEIVGGGVPRGDILPMALAFLVAAGVAYLVIAWLLAWLQRQSMTVFAVYRLALGALIFALLAAGAGR